MDQLEPPYVGCYNRIGTSNLGNADGLSGFGRFFVLRDFGADLIDLDEEPDGVVSAVAILTGSILQSGVGFGNFLFEVFVEFKECGSVCSVGGGEPDGASSEAFLEHDITGNELSFLRLEPGDKRLAIGQAPLVPRAVELFVDGIQRFEISNSSGSATENFRLLDLLHGSVTRVNVQTVDGLFETLLILLLGCAQQQWIMIGDVIQLVDESGQ